MERSWQRIVLVLVLLAISVGIDQWTKSLATLHLAGAESIYYWGEFFRLTYVKNRGAFLSLGAELNDQLRYYVLHIFPVILLVGMTAYVMLSRALGRWQVVGLSLVLGGGLSNVYDRLLYGEVIDFMHMKVFGLQTGIFNVADMFIMAGLFVVLPFAFRKQSREVEKDLHPVEDPEAAAEEERALRTPEDDEVREG